MSMHIECEKLQLEGLKREVLKLEEEKQITERTNMTETMKTVRDRL